MYVYLCEVFYLYWVTGGLALAEQWNFTRFPSNTGWGSTERFTSGRSTRKTSTYSGNRYLLLLRFYTIFSHLQHIYLSFVKFSLKMIYSIKQKPSAPLIIWHGNVLFAGYKRSDSNDDYNKLRIYCFWRLIVETDFVSHFDGTEDFRCLKDFRL